MRLEVCPDFFVVLLVIPLFTVVVEQARVVHQHVYCVEYVFVVDCPSSVVQELLYFMDTLHQFLELSVCVPWLQQLQAISQEVLVFNLSVLCEYMWYNFPHPEMGKSPIAVKHSGQKRFSHCFRDLFFFLNAPG